jgi:hypothetical protein
VADRLELPRPAGIAGRVLVVDDDPPLIRTVRGSGFTLRA